MRVILATSPHVRHAAVLQSDFLPDTSVMYSFAPVGLLSLAATFCRDRPEDRCEIYDLNRRILGGALALDGGFYPAVARDLCSHSPDVIGFMTECDSYHHVLQIVRAIKAVRPGCTVILGGPHASVVARETMDRCEAVDAVVVGEGECTFSDLLGELSLGSERPVAGAVRRTRLNGVVDGGARPLIDRLDDLPIPAYDLYRPDPGEEIFVEVGRGCPFKCEFCSTAPYWKRRHRVKSPDRVAREVLLIRALYGTSRVHFTHDLFTTDRDWVEAVCEALIRADAPVRWTCSARTDTVDEALLGLMSRAGCNAIYFGIESGSQRILREIHKDIPLSHSFETIDACRRQGITPNVGFIAGFPTEDGESFRETLAAYERSLRASCRPAHVFAFCPFAGSSMYSQLTSLRCEGHFVDLPLGAETDIANRQLVASDATLYGAYFRPYLPDLVPGEQLACFAIDEFSPLVEAALFPTLGLSALIGGMYEVFRAWLSWIQRHNGERNVSPYRRGYGTAAAFATFILEELSSSPGAPASLIAAARAVQTNLRVSESVSISAGTTMASYRSLILPEVDTSSLISLETSLERGSVVATLALEYDVTPALLGQVDRVLSPEPTYLAWQLVAENSVRLLSVNSIIFEVLEDLAPASSSAGELFLRRIDRINAGGGATASSADLAALLASLSSAAREGLVTIGAM